MNDSEIVREIDQLVEREHDLERRHAADGLSDAEREQLQQIEVRLDQCWDLLRQRRARRNAGQDPGEAQPRSPEVVEHYQQ
jgi:hypothetical protein